MLSSFLLAFIITFVDVVRTKVNHNSKVKLHSYFGFCGTVVFVSFIFYLHTFDHYFSF